ncbi:MAG TPA: cyclase family protein [Bacillales bacterium]|nr:cyclase family protein [Bacillales bacterium]
MFEKGKVIDLTVTISERLPSHWPMHMPFQRKNWNWYETVKTADGVEKASRLGPYYTEWLTIDEHTGTHFDAPSHFIPRPDSGFANAGEAGLVTGEKVNVEQLMGRAAVVDVTELAGTGAPGKSPYILPEHLERWEKRHGHTISEEIVLFYSGWDKHYVEGEEGRAYSYNALVTQSGPGWPSPHEDTIEWLYERGVRCVGTDGVSIGAAHEGEPAHVAGLSKGMYYVENLTNLGKLPPLGASFLFLPIKVEGSSGGPGRAVAFIE